MISSRVRLFRLTSALTLMLACALAALPAHALSDIKDITPPSADTPSDTAEPLPSGEQDVIEDSIPVIPDPDPLIKRDEPQEAESIEPTTPPAGPDNSASLPWNSSAAVRPPEDIMNIRRGPSDWPSSPLVGEMPGGAEGGNVEC